MTRSIVRWMFGKSRRATVLGLGGCLLTGSIVAGALACTPYYYDCYYYYGYYYPYCDYDYLYPYLPEDGYNPIYYREVEEEPVPNPDPDISPRRPDADVNVVNFVYMARTSDEGNGNAAQRLADDYPCGGKDDAEVVCADGAGAAPAGDTILLAYQLEEPVPLDDDTNFFILGFSFDQNDDPDDNFTPPADEEFHYFGGTDKWVVAAYQPSEGWVLGAIEFDGDEEDEVDTDARVIFEGDTVALVVPADEFDSDVPPARVSLFRHTGEFGADGEDWSGMVFPPLGEPLAGL